MIASIRHKLQMAGNVRDFARGRPDPNNPGYIAAIQHLTERLTRADSLAQQALTGRQAVTGAIATRTRLHAEIASSLAFLAGLAREAAREEPDLAASFVRPRGSGSFQAFLTRGRVAVTAAAAHRELLQRYGMPESLPDELGRQLDQFEVVLNERHGARAAHVGANADLEAVTAEVMGLVRQLDALIRFRFRNDPEALGAWRSARNVPWPVEKATGPAEGNGVRPAA